MLKLVLMGLNTRHEVGEIVSRQDENGPYVIIQCLNNCIVGTRNGMENARCGDMIIWRQGAHRFIGAEPGSEEGFCNNWLFVHSDELPEVLAHYNVPDNVLIPNMSHGKVLEIFSDLQYEYTLNLVSRDEKIELLLRMLFIQLGRQASVRMSNLSMNANIAHLPEFQRIRANIYAYPAQELVISELADELGMSAGRFSQLYNIFFSVSPKSDIIQARLSLAKMMLVLENEPLHSVARLAGFQNEYYFSRIFKKYTGCTPGAYRRKRGMI